jgi:hypothetical protein
LYPRILKHIFHSITLRNPNFSSMTKKAFKGVNAVDNIIMYFIYMNLVIIRVTLG